MLYVLAGQYDKWKLQTLRVFKSHKVAGTRPGPRVNSLSC